MKLKQLASIVLMLIISLGITGCRTKEIEGGVVEEKVKKIEIVWWSLFDPCDHFKGQIQAFQTANNQYKIECKKFSNAESYEEMLKDEIASGNGPDIFAIKNTQVLKNRKKITTVPPSIMTPEKFKETFFAVAADDLIFEDENEIEQIYAIPLYIDTLALYYNKAIFRDNLPSTDKPAITWEEVKEQVYGLTKKDNSIERFSIAGLAAGRSDNIVRAMDIVQLLMLQYGTKMSNDGDKKIIFADQQGTEEGTGKAYFPGQEALNLYTSFGLPSYKNYSWNQLITSFSGDTKEVGVFVKGKAAMIFGYSWLYDEMALQIDAMTKQEGSHITKEDIGIAPAPQLTNPSETGKQDAFASYYALTVSRNSENANAAWAFINFLSSAESLQDYHEKTNKPTPRKDMVEEQSTEKLFGVFARQASYAKSLRTFDDNAFIKYMSEAVDMISKSRKDTNRALIDAQKKMSCILEKLNDPTIDKDCDKADQAV